MSKKYSVCVVGATGAVGRTLLRILAERNFPVDRLYPLASVHSAGNYVEFGRQKIEVIDIAEFDFSLSQIAFFSAGGTVSAQYVPKAVEVGCVVIDNTSHFRMHHDVPLVEVESNKEKIADYHKTGIIANPNCSTMQMVVALKPIYDEVGITRVNVATYQAVSGSGQQAINELQQQSRRVLDGEAIEPPQVYTKQIAFNCLPHIDVFLDNGFSKEEIKMVEETKKIFADDTILVNPTTVRVPVVYGHSMAVHIQTRNPISVDQVKTMLHQAQGVTVMDDLATNTYPTALDAAHQDDVLVGRIRQGLSHPNELNLWIVADNILKGAATNAVQIAEELITSYLPSS